MFQSTSITSDDTRNYKCDDCGTLVGRNTSRVWSDVLTICDLCSGSKAEKYAALQQEIDAMVEELRGMNDPKVPCVFCVDGYIKEFSHVAEGVCFTCKGTGMMDNGLLPADMGICMGCDSAIAIGLLWGAEDAEVCPTCWEQVHGYPRWEDPEDHGFIKHAVCDMVVRGDSARERNELRSCGICHDIAGTQGEDW